MSDKLTRRGLLGRAGLALGGAVTLGVLGGCGEDDSTPASTTTATPGVADFPYQQHLPAGYQLGVAAIQQRAYDQYYAGGCCHGAYNALMKHLADTAGAPFNLHPLDFGIFGGGGIAGYGSICGAVLGSLLVVNAVVPNVANADASRANVRNRMMAELMRWYESAAFPVYVPPAVNAAETGLTLSFAAADMPSRQVVPGSHLCHASVTTWCAANGNVSSSGADKKARCARLTADVAGKVAGMLNAYLSSGAFTAGTTNPTAGCVGCHSQTPGAANPPAPAPVAAGMDCTSCHPLAAHPLPNGHSAVERVSPTECDTCH